MTRPDRRALLGCALLPLLAPAFPALATATATAAAGDETVFVVQVDLHAARAAGDVVADEPDDDVLRRVGEVLERRLELLHPGSDVRREASRSRLELSVAKALASEAAGATAEALEMPGRLRIWIEAQPGDGVDLKAETARLDAWLQQHPDAALLEFNVARAAARGAAPGATPAQGGPAEPSAADGGRPGIRWGVAPPQGSDDQRTERERAVPLLVPVDPAWRFRTEDLATAYRSMDRSGSPAVGFELRQERKRDFGDFTAAHVDRRMVIEVDGRCVSMATINERLPGQGIILGRFTAREVDDLSAALRGGELPAPVEVAVETR